MQATAAALIHFQFARQHRQVLHGRWLCRAIGVIAFAARGWGKTAVSLHLAAQTALALHATDTALWLTPVADQFRAAWRALRNAYHRHLAQAHRGDGRLSFVRAGALEFRSAFDPDHLRGKTYRAVVLDEAALIPADGWNACIRPTQRRADDWFVLLTTPRGQDWVVALAEENRTRPAHPPPAPSPPAHPPSRTVFRFPALWTDAAGRQQFADNLDRSRVRAAQAELPEAVFAREYLCDFGASAAACFREIDAHIDRDRPLGAALNRRPPDLTGPFVIGVDWGLARDYTVACVLDLPTGRVADLLRLRRVGSQAMCRRVADLAAQYDDAYCLCDMTGLQDQALALLQTTGAWAIGFIFTAQSKTDLIEHLLVNWERGRVRIPAATSGAAAAALIAELKTFEMQYTPETRQRSYGPAPGAHRHDDCVIALSLAWWAILQYPGDPRRHALLDFPPVDWDRYFL